MLKYFKTRLVISIQDIVDFKVILLDTRGTFPGINLLRKQCFQLYMHKTAELHKTLKQNYTPVQCVDGIQVVVQLEVYILSRIIPYYPGGYYIIRWACKLYQETGDVGQQNKRQEHQVLWYNQLSLCLTASHTGATLYPGYPANHAAHC